VSLSFAPKSESDFYLFSFCYDFNAVTGWERDWHKVWGLSHCDFSNQFLELIYHVLSISSQSTFFVSFSNPRLPCVAVFCENTPSVITPLCSCLYSESVCQFCSFFPWCATRRDTAPSIVRGCPLPFRLNRACPAAVSLWQVALKNNVSTLYLKCAVVVIWSTHYPVVNLPILIIVSYFFATTALLPCLSVYWSRVSNVEGLSIISKEWLQYVQSPGVHPAICTTATPAYMYRSVHVMCPEHPRYVFINRNGHLPLFIFTVLLFSFDFVFVVKCLLCR